MISNRLRNFVTSISIFVFLMNCSGNRESGSDSKGLLQFPREQTLYVGGFQWGAPATFNPLAVTPAWPITGNMNLIYEALFGYDLLDGKLQGVIGKSYEFKGASLEVALHEKARWQNGDHLTSDDVVYSFNLHKKYNTNFSNIWNGIVSVKKNGKHSVLFELDPDEYNPLVLLDIISAVQILPMRIFQMVEQKAFKLVAAETGAAPSNEDVLNRIRDFKNDVKPIGSGPYTLKTYTEEQIVLERVDDYWGNVLYDQKKPAPHYIIHRTYSSNDSFNIALKEGNLDISQTFCPQIWDKFQYGVGTWYRKEPYYKPGIMPALLMGISKSPFSDVNFRRAVVHAIDYEKIKQDAVYGYTPKLKPGLILPFGTEKGYFSEEDAKAFGTLYDPEKAKRILRDGGYKWGADGLLIGLDGKKIRTLYATCPKGWTDWEMTIKIAVEGLRETGIDVQEKFIEYQQWDNLLKRGLFDFTMKTPQPEQSASLPWARFDRVMSARELRPVGEIMYYNEGRYKNPVADSLLKNIPQMTDPDQIREAYRKLNRLFMEEMPIIPLMYRPWLFYQFSTKHWSNFPTESNPYAPPQCLMVGAGITALWGIKANN